MSGTAQKNQGTILVITLWIITLLSVITMSITYRMRMEIKMANNELNRDRAYYIANAGITQSISVLNQDANAYDALSEAWSNFGEEIYGINYFREIPVGEGYFTVSYAYESDISFGQQQVFYGMEDEERKININKAGQDVLESLPGITPEIALSIRAWRGDTELAPDVIFREDAYYEGLEKPYKRKGKPIDCIDELALVRGITSELLYGKDLDADGVIGAGESGLKKYITVYGDGLININTACATILRAIGFNEDLAYKIIEYRFGIDNLLGTKDDGIFTDVNQIAEAMNPFVQLLPTEVELINQKKSLLKVTSQFYTAVSEGSVRGAAKCRVMAVLDKKSAEGNQIIRWDE